MLVTRKFSGSSVQTAVSGTQAQYSRVGQEPDFEDLLADPVLRAMMARDKVREDELRSLIRDTRAALAQRGA